MIRHRSRASLRDTAAGIAVACGSLLLGLLLAACSRVTGLPEVPSSVSAKDAGLDALPTMIRRAEDPASPVRAALGQLDANRGPEAVRALEKLLENDPSDLVIGNAFRMAVYRLERAALAEAKARGERMPPLPDDLRGEPLETLERIASGRPGREIRLQIAMAHVDKMVLNPALEIKAPASIDSVKVLTDILQSDPDYVPALVARGVNYLYRPRSLRWPEHPAPPSDAASRDLSRAVAVGAKVGGAPARLEASLLMLLGDAYAHDGRIGLARSWWMMARERSDDASVREGVAQRMTWRDDEAADRLEDALDERMADMEHPVSDLAFLWGSARGPS